MENDFGFNCPGCGVSLTTHNAGGYQCYCETCVEAMPPLPDCPTDERGLMIGGFHLVGAYPNFIWEYSA